MQLSRFPLRLWVSRPAPSYARRQPPGSQITGGDDRDRTGDLLRAKQVLSQLSYVPWWAHLDLNQGPRPYQGRALTN